MAMIPACLSSGACFRCGLAPVAMIDDKIHGELTPKKMVSHLKLARPIFAQTSYGGHFGRNLPDFTWEKTDMAAKLKALERENRELRQANEILRKASAYFAQAELDRRHRS